MHPALASNAEFGFDMRGYVMHFEMKGERLSKNNIYKGVAEIKSYYPRFAHVKECCKACFRKAGKLQTYQNTSKPTFGKPFEKQFWNFFF